MVNRVPSHPLPHFCRISYRMPAATNDQIGRQRRLRMNWQWKRRAVLAAAIAALAGLATPPAHAQTAGKYLAPRDQVVAIRAGRLFDARSGMLLPNQVLL